MRFNSEELEEIASIARHCGAWMVLADALDTIPVVKNTAERNARFPAPQINQRVHNLETAAFERWNGTWLAEGIGFPGSLVDLSSGTPVTLPGGGRTVASLAAYLANNATYNVRDYGATGGPDDTAAVQAAGNAAAAAGGSMFIPDDLICLVDGTVSVNCSINGGGTLKLKAGLGTGMKACTLTGNDHFVSGVTFDASNNPASRGLELQNASGTRIARAKFTGARRGGIKIGSNVVDTIVVLNVFRNPGFAILYDDALNGDASSGSSKLLVEANQFIGDAGASLTPGDAIEINAPNLGFDDFTIVGNRIRDFWASTASAGIGIGVSGGYNGLIANNSVYGTTQDGIHIEDGGNGAASGAFGKSYNILIEGNRVILCGIGTALQAGITATYSEVTVRNNLVIGCGTTGIVLNARSSRLAASLTTKGLSIEGNTCRLNGKAGILAMGFQHMAIHNNRCIDNSQTTPNTADGIYVTADPGGTAGANYSVQSNTCLGANHRYAINNEAGVGNRVIGNTAYGATTGNIRDLGTNSEIWGNKEADVDGVPFKLGLRLTGGGALLGMTALLASEPEAGAGVSFPVWVGRQRTGQTIWQQILKDSELGFAFGAGVDGTRVITFLNDGTTRPTRLAYTRIVLPYSASIAVDGSQGNHFQIPVTTTTAFTINNPTLLTTGQRLVFDIWNNSGGVMLGITWGSNFRLNGAFTNPAAGNHRFIEFIVDTGILREVSRGAADQAN